MFFFNQIVNSILYIATALVHHWPFLYGFNLFLSVVVV
jgi:hypothetical protein